MADDGVVYRVSVDINANGDAAVRAVRKVATASQETAKTVEESTTKIRASTDRQTEGFDRVRGGSERLHNGISLLAGTVGLGALAYGFAGATKAGIAMQSQQALLANALRNTGIYSAQTMGKLTGLAASLSTRGGFGAQENIQALTQLTRVTGNATTATQLLGLATDVARGSHKDLLQTTKALALVEQGRTTGLSRLGIALPKGTTPQQALSILQARFGGATSAYSSSAAGQLGNIGQSFDLLKEDFGKAFLPLVGTLSRTLTGLMPQITRAMDAISKPLSATLSKLLPPLLNALVRILPPVLSVIDAVIPPITQVLNSVLPVLAGAVKQLIPVFQQALNALVPLFSAMVPIIVRAINTVLPPLLRIFSQIMPILTNAFQIIAPPLVRALSTVVTALAPVIEKLIISLAPLFPVLANAIAQILPPLAKAIASIMPALTQALTALLPPFVTAFNRLVPPLTEALLKLMPAINVLAGVLNGKLVHKALGFIPEALGVKGNSPLGYLNPVGLAVHATKFLGSLFQHHATGGIIGGAGGVDSQLSWMTPGEGVLTPPAVQAIGGQSGLNSLNATGHLMGGSGERYIVVDGPIQLKVGARVLAEEDVRFKLRKVALS